jgi:hypothetical protein
MLPSAVKPNYGAAGASRLSPPPATTTPPAPPESTQVADGPAAETDSRRSGGSRRPAWAAALGRAAKSAAHAVAKHPKSPESAAIACVPQAQQAEQTQRWAQLAADATEPNPQPFFDMLTRLQALPSFSLLHGYGKLDELVTVLSHPDHRRLREQCFAHPSLSAPTEAHGMFGKTLRRSPDAALYARHQLQHLVNVQAAQAAVKLEGAALQQLHDNKEATPAQRQAQAERCKKSLVALATLGVQALRMRDLHALVESRLRPRLMPYGEPRSEADHHRNAEHRQLILALQSHFQWHALVAVEKRCQSGTLLFLDVDSKTSRVSSDSPENWGHGYDKGDACEKVLHTDKTAVEVFLSGWAAAQSPEVVAAVDLVQTDSPPPGGVLVGTDDTKAALQAQRLMQVADVPLQLELDSLRSKCYRDEYSRRRGEVGPIVMADVANMWFGGDPEPERTAFWLSAQARTSSEASPYTELFQALHWAPWFMSRNNTAVREHVRHLLTRCAALPGGLQQSDITEFNDAEARAAEKKFHGLTSTPAVLQRIEMALAAAELRTGTHDHDLARVCDEVVRQFRYASVKHVLLSPTGPGKPIEFQCQYTWDLALNEVYSRLNTPLGLRLTDLPGSQRIHNFERYPAQVRDKNAAHDRLHKAVLRASEQDFIAYAGQFEPLIAVLKRTEPESFALSASAGSTRDLGDAEQARALQARRTAVAFLERHGVFERLDAERLAQGST